MLGVVELVALDELLSAIGACGSDRQRDDVGIDRRPAVSGAPGPDGAGAPGPSSTGSFQWARPSILLVLLRLDREHAAQRREGLADCARIAERSEVRRVQRLTDRVDELDLLVRGQRPVLAGGRVVVERGAGSPELPDDPAVDPERWQVAGRQPRAEPQRHAVGLGEREGDDALGRVDARRLRGAGDEDQLVRTVVRPRVAGRRGEVERDRRRAGQRPVGDRQRAAARQRIGEVRDRARERDHPSGVVLRALAGDDQRVGVLVELDDPAAGHVEQSVVLGEQLRAARRRERPLRRLHRLGVVVAADDEPGERLAGNRRLVVIDVRRSDRLVACVRRRGRDALRRVSDIRGRADVDDVARRCRRRACAARRSCRTAAGAASPASG